MFPFEDEDDELARDDYGIALRPGEFQLEDGAAPGKVLPHIQGLVSCNMFNDCSTSCRMYCMQLEQ